MRSGNCSKVLEKVVGSTLFPGINISNQRTADDGAPHTLQNKPAYEEAMFPGTCGGWSKTYILPDSDTVLELRVQKRGGFSIPSDGFSGVRLRVCGEGGSVAIKATQYYKSNYI